MWLQGIRGNLRLFLWKSNSPLDHCKQNYIIIRYTEIQESFTFTAHVRVWENLFTQPTVKREMDIGWSLSFIQSVTSCRSPSSSFVSWSSTTNTKLFSTRWDEKGGPSRIVNNGDGLRKNFHTFFSAHLMELHCRIYYHHIAYIHINILPTLHTSL